MQCEVSSKSVNLYHPTLCWIFYFCLFCWDSTSPFVHSHISVWPYFSPTLEWAPDTPITWAEEWSRRAKAHLIFNTNTDSESIVFPSPNFTHSSKAYTAPFCLTCLSLCHSVPTTCLLYDTSEALQRCLSSCWSNQLWNWKQHSCFCAALHLGSVLFLSSAAGITQHFSSQFGHAVPELDASLRYKAVWVLHSRS